MSQAWIEDLANEMKLNSREAAEEFGRQQHRHGIIDVQGKIFFTDLIRCLEEDFSELRRYLQGSPVSCETSVHREGSSVVRLHRDRFPWLDACVKHVDSEIIFDYIHGRGVAGNETLDCSTDRRGTHYSFQVDDRDRLFLVESFGQSPLQFETPAQLARHMIETLLQVKDSSTISPAPAMLEASLP